ncbi:MAG: glycosyltransferase family 2 protein, partial [Polaribacter sp.]|nr:glycosyltransferase family 2 protein [Polaribacter sp.]
NPQKTFLNFRNSLFNILKNIPKKLLLFVLISRLILDGIAGIKFILEFRPVHTLAILKAHLSFYKNFFKIFKKRRKVNKNQEYKLFNSIVWQYFVLGRKKFKDLR